MTFEELQQKTLEELINKYNLTNKATLNNKIIKLGACYKFNDMFYEPTALKRDLIYFDYLSQKNQYDALERIKIALYVHKIKFNTNYDKVYIVAKNNTTIAEVTVFDEVTEDYELFIYDRNYDYEAINNRLKTLKEINKYLIKYNDQLFTKYNDIYSTNPVTNRRYINKNRYTKEINN